MNKAGRADCSPGFSYGRMLAVVSDRDNCHYIPQFQDPSAFR